MNFTVCGTLVSLNSRHRVLQDRNLTKTPFSKPKPFLFTPAWLGRKAKWVTNSGGEHCASHKTTCWE